MQSETLKKDRDKLLDNLVNSILVNVPKFRENKYYIDRMGPEEKKMINLLMKSKHAFLLYYDALHLYRKLRYRG